MAKITAQENSQYIRIYAKVITKAALPNILFAMSVKKDGVLYINKINIATNKRFKLCRGRMCSVLRNIQNK